MTNPEQTAPIAPAPHPVVDEPEPLPIPTIDDPATGDIPEPPSATLAPTTANEPKPPNSGGRDLPVWLAYAGLVLVLVVGAYFRFVGINWDANQHLHPDERFMTTVASSIKLVGPFQYFDTANSTLNPFPYGSYTYGMFPLFLTRIVAEVLKMTDYDVIALVGRALSGLFDLLAVVMVFFLGARLYSRKVGVLAAGLYAAAVLPIQLSHYFTVDSFATVFILTAFFIALPAMQRKSSVWRYALFGLLTGVALACKINTAPMAGVIVLAAIVRVAQSWRTADTRWDVIKEVSVGLVVAGLVTGVTFRILQPYAFNGPSILGVSINQRWLDVIKEVTDQVAGYSEWPPNDHWADRSQLTYAWVQNSVWGLGLPLGLLGTLAWLWAAWRLWREASLDPDAKPEWQAHLILVLWVGGYFAWQNAQFWRYMRYFLPVYPMVVLLAAWALLEFFDRFRARKAQTIRELRQNNLLRGVAVVLLVGVVVSTYAWAFAFTRIYTRPVSRVTASEWMLNTLPGPLNLHIDTGQGPQNQPISVPYDLVLQPNQPWTTQFQPVKGGSLKEITAFKLQVPDAKIQITISRDEAGNDIVFSGQQSAIPVGPGTGPQPFTVFLGSTNLGANTPYYLQYTLQSAIPLTATSLSLDNGTQTSNPIDGQLATTDANPVTNKLTFTLSKDLTFDRLTIGALTWSYPTTSSVRLKLMQDDANATPLATSEANINLAGAAGATTFTFAPVNLPTEHSYFIILELLSGPPLHPAGATLVMETSWDDALPLRVDNYDPFGGIYVNTNIELFEPDTALKRDKIVNVLSQGDYLVISSNRAYDAMPRLPLRFPLTLRYYQELFDCTEQFIYKCAYPAEVGLQSRFGYQLVAVFESNPNLGSFQISDQTAEEAFTVYDHPRVMIFQKMPNFSADTLAKALDSVDLTQVLDQAPINYTAMPTGLLLTPDRAEAQLQNGTWTDMFNPASLLNSNQAAGVIAWYVLFIGLGLVAWPLVFVAMRGLPDKGYPFAKIIGLLFVTWAAWFSGSYKLLMFTQPTLWFMAALLALVSGGVAIRRREALVAFMRAHWRYLLLVEGITLGLFLFFLWVRWLNPDLWHPWLGGEKPADFSFFQAVIRSVYFPPYDAWLSDHYVNYYYYGFVLCAIPTKMLGIVPNVAYNLALPTLYSFAGIGAFCVAFNLVAEETRQKEAAENSTEASPSQNMPKLRLALMAGVTALTLMVLLGNLFEVRQLWQFLPEVADPPSTYSPDDLVAQITGVTSGAWRLVTGQTGLPHDKGTWYFGPSRAIRHDGVDTPITEFPLFSFLYADLHPHLSSMGIMLAALGWMVGLVFAANRWRKENDSVSGFRHLWSLETVLTLFSAGIIVGALQPTQTWDFPGFIILGTGSIVAATWLYHRAISRQVVSEAALQVVIFAGLSVGLYYPFKQWFGTDFNSIELWTGARTPIFDYFTVHGLFLFILITFLIWQSRSWPKTVSEHLPTDYLMNTPLGELLPKIQFQLVAGSIGLVVVLGLLIVGSLNDYEAVVFAAPLMIWLAILFFQPKLSLPQRVWTTIFGVGVGLTILVEFITLKGDLGRSNTVFKFYTEVWLFFSVAAGAALAWLWPIVRQQWTERPRRWWFAGLGALTLAAATYTVLGIYTKTTDRWPGIDTPPHTLNGMAYMLGSDPSVPSDKAQLAVYDDENSHYTLANDYAAMEWMLQQVKGTPHIVEGTSPLYRWGSRFAIYTGLPTVVGWDWHVKQHDSILPPTVVDNRISDVSQFYNTTDPAVALKFLKRYQVQYIIVGSLEHKYYDAAGLAKFKDMQTASQIKQVFPTTDAATTDDTTFVYQVTDAQ